MLHLEIRAKLNIEYLMKNIPKMGGLSVRKLFYSILTMVLILSFTTTCYAGDIPEALLGAEEAQV